MPMFRKGWQVQERKHEQNEIFPRARQTKVDMNSLGEKIAQRRKELMNELDGEVA